MIRDAVYAAFDDSLKGFWDERNNTLGKVPKRLRAGVARRARKRLDSVMQSQQHHADGYWSSSGARWDVMKWPMWLFDAAALVG